jgi:hypothetical protein
MSEEKATAAGIVPSQLAPSAPVAPFWQTPKPAGKFQHN